MKRSVALGRYTQWVINETIQYLYNNDIHYTGYGRDLPYWEQFHKHAHRIELGFQEPRRKRITSRSSDVCPSHAIPAAPSAPSVSAEERLQALGTIRCLRVAPLSRSGFSLLVRLTIPGRGNVYRYGVIPRRDDVNSLIHKWIDKGYWTRDRS